MGFFSKFRDTIFYKSDSELTLQIDALKKVIEKYPDNQELKKKLFLFELGLKGEQELEFELKNANIGMYVLHDVNLEFEDLKAQIDYIVITSAKIYFIECKNLVGNITVNHNGEFRREWNHNGNKITEGIYSPLRQAERHIDVFKKIWCSRNKGLFNQIRYENMDYRLVPLVVMANSKNILNITYAPKEIKQKVIRSDNLIAYLRNDIEKTDKDFIFKQKEMQKNADKLLHNYNKVLSRDYENDYINHIERNLTNNEENMADTQTANSLIRNDREQILSLRDKLIEFRKKRSREMNIPAYYIYTNDELEQLLIKQPHTIDDLVHLKILPTVKIKTHGEEIIKILNS